MRFDDARASIFDERAGEPERERIEGGWWDGGEVGRDYFVARSQQGERLWVFRELGGRRRWFLQGWFV